MVVEKRTKAFRPIVSALRKKPAIEEKSKGIAKNLSAFVIRRLTRRRGHSSLEPRRKKLLEKFSSVFMRQTFFLEFPLDFLVSTGDKKKSLEFTRKLVRVLFVEKLRGSCRFELINLLF